MSAPKVTIGIPTFNRAHLLKRAIEQILTQSFQDFELIICNDGSTDETVNVVKSFVDKRIIFLNEKNKGLPHPLNIILETAKGGYIIILHDHDKFNSMLIEKSVNALDSHPEAGFVLQACAWINSDEMTGYQEFNLNLPLLNTGKKYGEWLLLNNKGFSSPIHACCMVRKTAYDKVGKYYDPKFGWYTDVDLWLRLLRDYDFIYLPEVLFIFTGREHNHKLNKKVWLISKWQHEIFLENTYRYFENDSGFSNAVKIIVLKIKKDNLRNLGSVIASNDLKLLYEGFEFLKSSENYFITKFLIQLMKSSVPMANMIMNLSLKLNGFRKSLKKKDL